MTSRIRPVPRHRRAAVTVLIALAGFGAAPVPANAAVTLGSDLAADPNSTTSCGFSFLEPNPACTFVQTQLPGRQLTAPFDGVIVRWRLKQEQNADWGPVSLRVGQQVSGTVFRGVRSSPVVDPPPVSGPPVVHVFETQLPIGAGQFIGLDLLQYSSMESFQHSGSSSVTYLFWFPPLGDGEERAATAQNDEFEFLFNADLEPDCDGDGLGDESQDPSLLGGDCPVRGRTVALDASKNKVKEGTRVTLTGRVAELFRQGECQSAQTLQLQRKRPTQTTFTTVDQLQTDAAGNFVTRKKVKKTFVYRAQVAETPTCGAGLSNTEKVKVKKK
jgi:hypothetical protein